MKNIIILFTILSILSIFIYYMKHKDIPKKICPEGSAGNNCEYTDIDNCNGHGKVSINEKGDPICKCDGNFDGENCEKCKPGFIGYNSGCTYSDNITCNGKGQVRINWTGKPICLCTSPYAGDNCEKCIPGLAGDSCQYSSKDMCNDRGDVYINEKGRPACKCKDGWYGPSCNESGSLRCNGKGMYNFTKGKCECNEGYAGSSCQFDSSNCKNRGKLYDYIENPDPYPPVFKCSCPMGYGGNLCQFNQNEICGNRGYLSVTLDGKPECICTGNFQNNKLTNCTECKPGFFGKNCNFSNKDCSGFPISNLKETPITTFDCKCSKEKPLSDLPGQEKTSGDKCQFNDRKVCNNRGYIREIQNMNSSNQIIKCTCDGGDYSRYDGDRCESCKPGFKGPTCDFSDATTCNGNGKVSDDGRCTCFNQYTGEYCNKCKETNNQGKKYYELRYNNKLVCSTEDDCYNRGKPSSLVNDGNTVKCICDSGYTGDNCSTFFLK